MSAPFTPDEIIEGVGIRLAQLRQSMGKRDMLTTDLRHEVASLRKEIETLRADVEALRRASLPAEPRKANLAILRSARAA